MVKCVQAEGGFSKNWSRQSGCKCCWKPRLQNIMSDPHIMMIYWEDYENYFKRRVETNLASCHIGNTTLWVPCLTSPTWLLPKRKRHECCGKCSKYFVMCVAAAGGQAMTFDGEDHDKVEANSTNSNSPSPSPSANVNHSTVSGQLSFFTFWFGNFLYLRCSVNFGGGVSAIL